MIIIIVGGIGSGKTLSAVKEIRSNTGYPITNFNLRNMRYTRLKYSDVIKTETEKADPKSRSKPKSKQVVNWDFWEKIRKTHKNFSIYLDEAHGIANSRSSLSTQNKLISLWFSQIRKILSDSETNHLYIISQKLRKLDVNIKDLCHIVIECRKIIVGNVVYIIQSYYDGIDAYELRSKPVKKYFRAKNYYRFYNSYEMVRFGDAEVYL